MGNCLKTQLKESVQSSDIITIGHMRIYDSYKSMDSTAYKKIRVVYKSGVNGTTKISSTNGNVGFISSSTSSDKVYTVTGNSIEKWISLVPNENFVIDVSDKYDIINVIIDGFTMYDASQLAYTDRLSEIAFIRGGFKNVFNFGKYNAANIISFDAMKTPVELSCFKDTTNLTTLFLTSTIITGDISNIGGNTNLANYQMSYSTGDISGDISTLQNTKITDLNFDGIAYNVTGDLAKVPATCKRVSALGNTGVFNWSTTRTGNCVALYELTLAGGDLDRMLTNMAELNPIDGGGQFGIRIDINTYPVTAPTVASSVFDTLKNQKGYLNITIDGVDY